VRYGRRLALDAVSGEFAPGSLTAVVGANGAGKSTLLAAIAGMVRLAGGAVDCPVAQQLAYLPQLATIDLDYPMTVAELIALGGWREFGAFGAPDPALLARANAAAATVGLTQRLPRRIGALSVGELQPFAAVDAATTSTLLDLVAQWHQDRRTVIAVLHDLDLVRARFPATLVLAQRCIAWGATEAALPAITAR
jgi:zinc/manganese transport system ATP-binding protein